MTRSPASPESPQGPIDQEFSTTALGSPTLAPAKVMQISPLIAAGSRFPVGTGNPDEPGELGPIEHRSFLLRGAESVRRSPGRAGGTPKVTTGYDGTDDDESEDFTQPDFSP